MILTSRNCDVLNLSTNVSRSIDLSTKNYVHVPTLTGVQIAKDLDNKRMVYGGH